MKLAHSLLGSAAALCAAMAGLQAADLPVQKAAPVEYVRVCTTAGEGFFYIPGTDTCLRIGGRVRAERIAIETFDRRDDAIGFLARGRLNVDTRTETEYGTLRAFFRYEITRSTGAYFDSGSALNGVGDPGQARASPALDRAFVQFGGLTAGRTQSFFDFYANDLAFSAQLGSDLATQVLADTYTVGDFSATISMEDGIERRVFNGPTDGFFPGVRTPNGIFFPESIAPGGETAPDGVLALGVTKEWGSAQLSGAVHQVRSANFTQNLRDATSFRPDVVDTEYGYAVQGGVKINLPFLAAGDVLWLQAAYADGAINYLGFGSDTSVRNRGPFILNQSDAFVNAFGDLKTTEGFSAVGAFSHYFTPQIRGELMGSYGRLDYDRSATGRLPATAGRIAGARFGFVDTQEYRLEASAIYSPVKDLDIGVDVLYQNIDPKGRVIGAKVGPGGAAPRLYDDQDIFIGRMRVQRDF